MLKFELYNPVVETGIEKNSFIVMHCLGYYVS